MTDVNGLVLDVNKERMFNDIKWLVENTPYRLASSRDEFEASVYICDQMRKVGLEVKNLEFNTYNSDPISSSMEILSPVHKSIASLPCAHIRSTKPEGEEFEVVYVNDGSYKAYEGLDVNNKVVLVEVSYAPPVPEKARIAYEIGAAGIICMNWGNDEEVICHRGLKAVWGNPTEETVGNIPDLIGVSITRNDGLALKDFCLSGETVKVRICAYSDRKWSVVHQPFGILHGNGKSDEFILVSAHIDAWCPGVTCNATGDSTVLEICRVLAKYRDELSRDIYFVFWDGHEIAEAAGSTWFVDNYWDLLNKHCIAYINIDSTGLIETEKYEIKASDELLDFSVDTYNVFSNNGSLRLMTLKKIGDQSFMGIGVPSIAERMSFTEEYMEHAHGATLGWWNHTNEDGLDKCDPEVLEYDTRSTVTLLYKLATIEKLPYDFSNYFKKLGRQIEELSQKYNVHLDFSDLKENINLTGELVSEIQNGKETYQGSDKINLYNKYVMTVSRLITNVFKTYTNKYQQDSYGYTKLTSPIPLFFDLEKMNQLDKDSFEYGLLSTQIVKNKNRINDSLKFLIDLSVLNKSVLRCN